MKRPEQITLSVVLIIIIALLIIDLTKKPAQPVLIMPDDTSYTVERFTLNGNFVTIRYELDN